MRNRLGLSVLLSVTVALIPAAVAWACNEPRGYPSSSSGGPGDSSSYSITDTEPGATYDVYVGGQYVGSGTDSTPEAGAGGAFEMPYLGDSPKTVYVEFHISHEGSTWISTEAIQYTPPPPPPAPDPEPAEPPTPKPVPDAHDPVNLGALGKRSFEQRVPEDASRREQTGAYGGAFAGGIGVGAAPPPSAPQSPGSATAEQEAVAVPTRIADAVGDSTELGPASVPNLALGVAALILIAGTVLSVLLVYLLRSGPDPNAAIRSPALPGPDPLETELQEILADEMARSLLAQLSPSAASADQAPSASSQQRA